MQRIFWALMMGAALGLAASAEPAAVKVAPAAEEVQALQEAWAQVVKFFEEFVTEIKSAVNTLSDNDQDILAKYRALAVQLKDLEAKILQIQETFAQKSTSLEKGLGECAAKIAELRKAMEELAQGYKAADAELEAKIAAALKDLRQSLEQVAVGYQKADADLEARVQSALEELRRGLEGAIAACREVEANLGQKIATLGGQIEGLQKRVEALESYDIGNVARRVLGLEQAIQAVQAKIENNREKIAALEKTVGGFAADIASLKESVLSLQTQVGDHEARIAAVEESMGTNIQDLSARVDAVQALAILGLLAGVGAIVLLLLGIGG